MCESWSFNIYKWPNIYMFKSVLNVNKTRFFFFKLMQWSLTIRKKNFLLLLRLFFFGLIVNFFFLSLMFDILCKSFSFVFCLYTFKMFFLVYIPFYELVHLVLILHLFSSFSHFVIIFILFPKMSLVLDISSWNCLFSVKFCLFLYSMFKCNIKTCWIFSIFYL